MNCRQSPVFKAKPAIKLMFGAYHAAETRPAPFAEAKRTILARKRARTRVNGLAVRQDLVDFVVRTRDDVDGD